MFSSRATWATVVTARAPTARRSFVRDVYGRSERKAARISVEKSAGSSQAAKWPPLSTALK
jgi:hypothetical protein